MSNMRRRAGAFLVAAVVGSGIGLASAPAQALEYDVCSSIEESIAAIEASRLPQRVKDALIAELVSLAEVYGCDGD